MNKIKIPAGTKQNFETVFEDLQTKIQANINNRLSLLLGTSNGLPILKNNGALVTGENDFKISLYTQDGLETRIQVQGGTVFFGNGEFYTLPSTQETSLTSPAASTVYLVKLRYAELGGSPVAAQNSFLFDTVSDNPYSQKNTRFSDSYTIIWVALASGTDITYGSNEIPLALVKTGTVGASYLFQSSAWTYLDSSSTHTAVAGVVDLRASYDLKVRTEVLDDSLLVFKDRDSTGTNKLAADLEVNNFTTSGLTAVTGAFSGAVVGESTGQFQTALNVVGLTNTGYLNFLNSSGLYSGRLVFDASDQKLGFTDSIGIFGSHMHWNNSGYFGWTNYVSFDPLKHFHLHQRGSQVTTTLRLDADSTSTDSDTDTVFDISVLANDNGSNLGKLTVQPVTNNRSVFFKDVAGNDLLAINPGNRSIAVGDYTATNGLILNTTSLFKQTSQFDAAVSMDTLTASGIAAVNTLTLNGSSVKVEESTPDPVLNFRIYDVFPTEDITEKKAYLHLKWGYDNLVAIDVDYTAGTVTLPLTNEVGETNTFNTQVARSIFKFSSVGEPEFDILSSTISGSYRVLTLDTSSQSLVAGTHISSAEYPSKILDDTKTKGYTVSLSEFDATNANRAHYKTTHTLGAVHRTSPELIVKLELGKWWFVKINGFNSDKEGLVSSLPFGSYDPDHAAGGQASVTYQSPYQHKLPFLDNTGSISLTSTNYGFNIDITGWEDTTDSEQTAHEFEIIYSTVAENGFENYTNTTHLITKNRFVPISSNQPNTWYVSVRPLQNKQVVGTAVASNIVAGGGGVAPSDEAWHLAGFNVETVSGTIANIGDMANSNVNVTMSDLAMYGSNQLNGEWMSVAYSGGGGGTHEARMLDNLTTISGSLMTQRFKIESLTDVSGLIVVGDPWTIGVDKASRLVHEFKDLPVDYTITNIAVNVTSVDGVSSSSPAVMRFYQYPEEASASLLEIAGVGTYSETLNFDITQSVYSPRKLVIDLWDPSDSPNNTCSVRGGVIVWVKPKINILGGTTQDSGSTS